MTWTLTKIRETWQESGRDDPSGLTRVYFAEDSEGPVTDVPVAIADLQQTAGLPKIGDPLLGAFAVTSLRASMRCRSVTATVVDESAGKLSIQVEFATLYSFRQEVEKAYMVPRRSIVYRERRLELWRSLADAAAPPGTGDIGGTKVDTGGSPLLRPTTTGEVVVYYLVDSIQISLATLDATFRSLSNKLNSAAFLGWAVNTLRCTSVELNQERDEYWLARLTAIYDPLKHYTQQPQVDADGRIKISAGNAAVVEWKRDYDEADLNSFLTGSSAAFDKHRAEKGEYPYP